MKGEYEGHTPLNRSEASLSEESLSEDGTELKLNFDKRLEEEKFYTDYKENQKLLEGLLEKKNQA